MNKKLLIGYFAILLFAGVAVATVSNLHVANSDSNGSSANRAFTGYSSSNYTTYVDTAPPPANLGSDGDVFYQLDQPITQGGATLYIHFGGYWVLIGRVAP